jgi:RHS repeat-associated protein
MTSWSRRRLVVAVAGLVLASVAVAPGSASAAEWSPVELSQATSSLDDVWCEQDDYYREQCTAVGGATDHEGVTAPQVLTSEYGSWREESIPALAGSGVSRLTAVSCREWVCMALGSYGEPGYEGAVSLRREGSTWSFVDIPWHHEAASIELSGVTCSAWFECMAVGSYVDWWETRWAFAVRWNGWESEEWLVETLPIPEGATSSELSDVSCPDTSDYFWSSCTAAGSYVESSGIRRPLVLDWAYGAWTVASSPQPDGATRSELADVSCPAPESCTAVGSYRDESDTVRPLAMTRNGGGWAVASTPSPPSSELSSVSCWESSQCVAIGRAEAGSAGTPLSLYLNGTTWSDQPVEPPYGAAQMELRAVTCPSEYGYSGCTAVGSRAYGEMSPRNLMYAFDGYWRETGGGGLGGQLSHVSCVSDDACIGTGPISQGYPPPHSWQLIDGDWSLVSNPSRYLSLGEISCTAVNRCFALDSTKVWRGTGWTWSEEMFTTDVGVLRGVSCGSHTSCMVVGDRVPGGSPSSQRLPVAAVWNGSRWASATVPNLGSPASLRDVSCVAWDSCVAVGYYTVGGQTRMFAARWNGVSWSVEPVANPPGSGYATLNSVSCGAVSSCTAVGSHRTTPTSGVVQPLILRWNGISWALQAAPPDLSPVALQDVSCPSASACVAISANWGEPAVIAWDGVGWSVEPIPSVGGADYSVIYSLSCASREYCLAVGHSAAGPDLAPLALVREDEPPPPVEEPPLTLYEPPVVNRTGATLHWARWRGTGFAGYEVHRGAQAGFTPSPDTHLATIDNIEVTSYRDDSAAPGLTVFYKLVSGGETSNEQRVVLPGEEEPARAVLQPDPERGQAALIASAYPMGCSNTSHDPELDVSIAHGRRALLRWDLRDIPADSRVRSARLMLYRKYHIIGSPTRPATFTLRAISREWRESETEDCHGDGVNWQRAYAGVTWTTPGADAGPVLKTVDVPGETPPGWQEWDISALVQEWIAGRRANHGAVVEATSSSGGTFHSDDSPTAALRPKLEIVFDDPEPVRVPTVDLTAPRGGERLRGTVVVEGTAGDDRRVERVEFLLDGQELGEDATAPYSIDWDTRSAANGSHTLRARAIDDVGNVGLSEPVSVEVANFAPPTVRLTNPPAGYPGAVKLEGPTALDGLAGYWRLGETSGGAEDASGNGRTGTYLGAVERGLPGLIAGDPDRSVRLTPTTGRVELTNLAGWLGDRFTAEGWIKHPGLTTNGTESHVASRNPGGADGWKLGVRRTGTGAQEAFFNFKGATATTPISPSPTDPPLYHLVGVYDGTTIRLHLDGRQVGQTGVNGTANMSVAPLIGPASAADIHVDDVALYHAALSPERIRAHFELGRGRAFLVEGQNELSATASAAPGRTVREVRFLVDGQLAGRDDTAPYSVTWSTLPAGSPVPDGPHVVTAQVVDDHDQITTSDAVTVNVANNTEPQQRVELSAESELPETLVDEPNSPAVPVDIRIRNSGTATIPGTAAVLRYRWERPDDSLDDTLSGSYPLGGDIAPGAHRVVRAMVRAPSLPEGLARSRMTLQFDLRDTGGSQTWWAERGNPPLEHSVMVQRRGAIGLGLERYYQYDGEALGAGMSQLVNLASGNNIVRFSPFESPGRGLSTVVDVTYNAHSGETKGSALGDGWLLSVSSISPFGEPLRCGVGTDAELKPDKCEEYALKDQQDLPDLALELTDADGTVHRFKGRRTGGRTFWRAPQGVHLYLHQLEADEQPACDIVEPGMAYQPDIQPQIRALWAFTRPDGTTFYYQRNGWPTGVADRNGNCIDLELTAPPSKPDRVRVSAVVDAAGVADPSLRPRRTFAIDYYDDEPHPLGGKTDFPKVRSIRDHTGSKLSFHYYKDDRPLRITQQGGTTPEGLAAPDRSWVFTYADWDIDEIETVANLPNPADRVNPDPTITDNSYLLYSVRDPRGHETRFTYHGEKPQEQKDNAGKLKYRVDREGETTTYNYNLATDTTTVDLPAERQSRYAFDAEGSVLSMIDKVSAAREEIVRVSWTADRHVFRVTEPTDVGVPAEHFTEFEYNQNGLLTKRRDQLDRVTQLEYEHIAVDDDDQESGWVDPDREIKHISQLTKRITPRGKEWEFDHDDETGNLVQLTDPEGFASRFGYDERGNLTSSEDGLLAGGGLPDGELERVTVFDGHDANGLPTLMTDALGNETRFCSDDDGLLRWVQDARHADSPLPPAGSRCFEHDGRRFRSYFDYDPFHRLGRTSEPKSTEHLNGSVLWTHARYDANDNVEEQFGAQDSHEFQPGEGTRTTIAYDKMDRPTTETLFDFDTLPPQQQGGPLEEVEVEETTAVKYDAAGRVQRVTSPRGVATGAENDFSTSYVYDLLDRPLLVTRHGIGGQERPSWFCYDAAGDLRSITRPRETPEPAVCGPEGAEGDPGPKFTWRYEYTPAHELRRVISPAGNNTTYRYDADGNLAETVNPEGEKVTRSYDGRDLPVETIEDFEPDKPVTTRFAYDAVGNLRHVFSPRAIEAADGQPTPESDFVHTTEYDALDRPVRELLPRQGDEEQRYVHRRFDAIGNLTHVTVPVLEDDLDTLLGSPEQARECATEQIRKWVTCYEHFDPGWIKTSTDINGPVLYDYDAEGRQIKRTATEIGETTSRSYYRDGLLQTFTDEGDHRLLRRYDANGNPRFLSDSGVSAPRKAITLELEHNGFDEVASTTASEEGQRTKITEYTYWLDGLVHTRLDDRELDGSTVERPARRHEFLYDPDGRLSVHLDLGRDAGTEDDRRIRHDYFPTGRERERVVENWVGGAFEPRQTTQREYFDNGLPKTLNTWGGAPEDELLRESHTLSYRDTGGVYVNGHMTSDEFFRESPEPGALCSTPSTKCTQRFVYDGGDRLVEEYDGHDRRIHYDLTPAGGIEKKYDADDTEAVFFKAEFEGTRMARRTLDPNDHPDVLGPTEHEVFHYEDGNLNCITRPGADPERDCSRSGGEPSSLVVEDFAYDYRDRLEAWERPEDELSVTYEHDALDRPIRETEVSDGTTTVHELSYIGATRELAGEEETTEEEGAGVRHKTRSYSHDAYGRLVAMSYRADDGPTHELSYAYDPRGSVSMLLDQGGAVKAAYGYTAYGEPDQVLTAEQLPGSTDPPGQFEQVNPFRYSSKRSDALSDTIDMGARQFGPQLGQFLQADQYDGALADLGLASDPLTGNRYALAAGNPVSYIEVDGHIWEEAFRGGKDAPAGRFEAQTPASIGIDDPSGGGGTGGTTSGGDTTSRDGSSPPYAFYPAGTTPPNAAQGTRLLPDTFRALPCVALAGDCTIEASGPNVKEYERGNFFDYARGAFRGYTSFDVGGNEESELFALGEAGGSLTFIGPGGARNAARGAWRTFAGRETQERADDILPTPSVGDRKLRNYVEDLYKGTSNPRRVGTGTTADAVRHELATGQSVGGKFHIQKAQDTARGLRNWLRSNPGADPHDRLVARSLYDELVDALGRAP